MDDHGVNELIESRLADLLMEQLQQHVPDDDLVGIVSGWIGYAAPREIYWDVQHRLPQLIQEIDNGQLHATLGRHGGIRITNHIDGEVASTGVWTDDEFKLDEPPAGS